ncbi:nucleolin-like [Forsythia ovata]|uniref:Nucleolin-like n=1 Tax=Forsythia ovata TaxID=205694 RepID=A0ABD1TRP8_9LAMI
MEGMHEEPEPQEDSGHVREGHAEIVDAAKKEEHHEDVKEKLKRKEFEIFVGGLDKDATEDDLRKVFSEVGNVTDVRLMMNPQTKKNKGFAFLRFATVEQAKRAFTELKNPLFFLTIILADHFHAGREFFNKKERRQGVIMD